MKRLLTTLAAALLVSGCRTTVVTVSKHPDGTLTVKGEVYSLGNNTKVDELTIPTTLGPASLKGASSESKLTDAAVDIAATARKVVGAGVRGDVAP